MLAFNAAAPAPTLLMRLSILDTRWLTEDMPVSTEPTR